MGVSLVAMMICNGRWASSFTVAAEDCQQFVQLGLHAPEVTDVASMYGVGVVTSMLAPALLRISHVTLA